MAEGVEGGKVLITEPEDIERLEALRARLDADLQGVDPVADLVAGHRAGELTDKELVQALYKLYPA